MMYNRSIKTLLLNDSIFWFAQYLFLPLASLQISTNLAHGNVFVAGLAVGLYFLTRGITDILSTLFYKNQSRKYVLHIMILGIGIVSTAYACLIFTRDAYSAVLIFGLMGVGFGVYNPAKLSFYSSNLDKGAESKEWGILDGVDLISLAIATIVGGLVFKVMGFAFLLALAAALSLVSTLPLLGALHNKV